MATLALDANNKGKQRTDSVIGRYEEVTRLDGTHWDWVQLGRLYREAGRLQDANRAVMKATNMAEGQRDRSVALDELGEILKAQGDLARAKQRRKAWIFAPACWRQTRVRRAVSAT